MGIDLDFWMDLRSAADSNAAGEEFMQQGQRVVLVPEIEGALAEVRMCDDEDRAYTERWHNFRASHWISFWWDKSSDLEHMLDCICSAVGQMLRSNPDAPAALELNGDTTLLRRDGAGVVLSSDDDFWSEHRRRLLGCEHRLEPLNELGQ